MGKAFVPSNYPQFFDRLNKKGNTGMKAKTAKSLIAIGLLCISASSMAQWQWVDRSGRKVFSDQPPPADIPEKSILKRPGSNVRSLTVANDEEKASAAAQPASAARAPQANASEPGLSPAEKKKQQEEEAREAAKRKAEEEKIAKAKKENCDRAKSSLETLKAGVRIRTVNSKGEHTVLDDQARAAEEARIRKVMAESCK